MGSDSRTQRAHNVTAQTVSYTGAGTIAVFRGGPLDGRTHDVGEPIEGQLIRHLHLHGGPKIETWYRLTVIDESWVFELAETDDD